MKVSRNSYYHWLKTKGSKQEKASLTYLKKRIEILFHQSKEVYGCLRIKKALEREGLCYATSYIALLMRELGLKSVIRKKYVTTTDSDHNLSIAENRLNRDFTSVALGEKLGLRYNLHQSGELLELSYYRIGFGG